MVLFVCCGFRLTVSLFLYLTLCHNIQMPYLHWETDRNRTRMAEAVRKQVDRDTQEDRDKRSKDKSRQRRERGLPLPHLPRPMHTDPDHYKRPKSGADVIPETVEGIL